MSIRLSPEQAEFVNHFKATYPRMSDSELLGMALEYYVGAIKTHGMDVQTWMPLKQSGKSTQKQKAPSRKNG